MAPQVDPSDPRWQLLEQVVQSSLFEKSPKMRSFLRFICERELTGQREEINEQEIGVHVFGRAPGYNSGDDSIVRSQARLLRQRLAEYFSTAGASSSLRIEIPKGSYVPVFESCQPVATSPAGETFVVPVRASRRPALVALMVGSVILAAGAAVFLTAYLSVSARGHRDPQSRFWNALFDPHRTAVIVPADSTLILIEELTGQQVTFESYLNRKYLSYPALKNSAALSPADLDNSHYTSMADLGLVARIVRVPQVPTLHAEIRYARELSMSDAREDNLILIGGSRANPWVELFAGRMNFGVNYDWQRHQNAVVNKNPRNGESAIYAEDPADPAHRVYGVVAYEPSLDREGDTLLVAGTSSAGTQAAADFLFSSRLFADYLRQIQHADGSIPHFEILLEARSLSGNVAGSTILASRLVL